MRVLLLAAMLVLACTVFTLAKEPERPRCENCGMYTDISSTNALATLKIKGKEAEHNFVCLECVYVYMHEKVDGEAKLTGLKIIDYATFGTKSQRFIDGMTAWYLVGTKPLKGSMAPYIAAFASKVDATNAQKKLGGKLKNFDDTWAAFSAEKSDTNGSAGEDEYVCSCTGGCCDDVHASAPGNCPKCGMKLLKKGSK